jgi:hypothetical protein
MCVSVGKPLCPVFSRYNLLNKGTLISPTPSVCSLTFVRHEFRHPLLGLVYILTCVRKPEADLEVFQLPAQSNYGTTCASTSGHPP